MLPFFIYFQTFKPLVDTVGLYKGPKGSKLPVEFLSDLKLDFQDCNKLTSITVSCSKIPAFMMKVRILRTSEKRTVSQNRCLCLLSKSKVMCALDDCM